jgi:hypothetical protein
MIRSGGWVVTAIVRRTNSVIPMVIQASKLIGRSKVETGEVGGTADLRSVSPQGLVTSRDDPKVAALYS